MEKGKRSEFECFLQNHTNLHHAVSRSSPPPPPTPANNQSSFRNLPMPENHLNVGLSVPAYHPRQENSSSLYDLETGFRRLNLSSANHSPFLGPYANYSPFLSPSANHSQFLDPPSLNGGRGLTDSMFDARQMNADLERLRFQAAMAEFELYGEGFDGFNSLNANYFNSPDQFDHTIFNDGRRNLVNPQPAMRPRNGLQFQSPYLPNRNGFMLENPTQAMGRFSLNEYSNSLLSSLYMNGNGNSNNNVIQLYNPRLPPRFPDTASLEEMRGKVLSLATDQNGCRFLQDKFEEGKPEDIDLIFSEVRGYVRHLMVHQFGNYLIQKFFDVCDQQKISQMLASVISHEQTFVKICLDIHGTRAMQKLLENLTTQEQRASVVSVLERVTVTVPLTKNAHGHHVIQHCLKFFQSDEIASILRVVAEYCVPISTDKSGCCVIQQCVARAAPEQQERLVAEITANAVILAQDPYGNYVVQFVLDMGNPHYTANILAGLAGSFVSLSMDKYGSNVVEKCIKECSEDQSAEVIKEIVYSQNFLMVLQNAYGNYVAQSALLCSKGRLHDKVSDLIQEYHPFLHSHPHGKRALARTRGSKNHNHHHHHPMFRRM